MSDQELHPEHISQPAQPLSTILGRLSARSPAWLLQRDQARQIGIQAVAQMMQCLNQDLANGWTPENARAAYAIADLLLPEPK